jgi:phosphotransferase system IIB component
MRFFSIENKITKLKIQISNKTQFSKNQYEKQKGSMMIVWVNIFKLNSRLIRFRFE